MIRAFLNRTIIVVSSLASAFTRLLWHHMDLKLNTYIRSGLFTEGNLRFKIDWASLIVGSKFTVFALFYFVFEGNFPSTSPRGAYIWRGLYMEGLIFGILRYVDLKWYNSTGINSFFVELWVRLLSDTHCISSVKHGFIQCRCRE